MGSDTPVHNIEEQCAADGHKLSETPHECPFRDEIFGDLSLCRCCPECVQWCAYEI